ncbi:MAG TPA: 4Fe-4S binding protein [Desulfotomaculum sp.]|nr:4Fe-4S binding protein [Desulfotomaculum sp.]
MKEYTITREKLFTWLDSLARDYTLVAPVAEEETVTLFKPVPGAASVALDYANSTVSPKGWIFPQTEKMFFFNTAGGEIQLKEPATTGPAVLFGIRPCDVKGILALDPVFNGPYQDCYYQSRRENTILVALSCTTAGPHCFCTAMGGGPADGQGADILLTAMDSGYGVEVLTARGEELLVRYADLFTPAGENQVTTAREELGRRVAGQFSRRVDTTGIKEFLNGHFELPYWEELARRCLGCGICTYVCPTCHCFDIFDQARGDNTGARSRCWDSCMFSHFTRMAGGHNPRPTRKERVRNRFLHKLKYHRDRYNLDGCVGCGRCVTKCPVNIDIRQVIADLQEVARHE